VAEVNALLGRLGLGRFDDPSDVTRLAGRNDTWSGRTNLGEPLLVKRFRGSPADALRRMRRSLAFERVAPEVAHDSFVTPRCRGYDEDARVVAFDFVADARTGADLLLADEFTDDLAHRAGRAVGELHAATVAARSGPDGQADHSPRLPSRELLEALPLTVYAAASAAELQAWSLMQHDRALAAAIGQLLTQQEHAVTVPAHCDLRLEQFFVAADTLFICDWEEFRLADAARDVGSFAGEWLYQAVLSIADDEADGEALSDTEIVRRISVGLDRARPRIAAFWRGYQFARADIDAGLGVRATAFAGWHMFDRMLAVARRSARLRALDRAAAGIGRTILLSPADHVGTLGLAR
jgi:hypothetical protein